MHFLISRLCRAPGRENLCLVFPESLDSARSPHAGVSVIVSAAGLPFPYDSAMLVPCIHCTIAGRHAQCKCAEFGARATVEHKFSSRS
eukprot:305677-Prymnesium_polylepis.1